MKVVITGANGFLGRKLSRYFIGKGWKVIAVARSQKGLPVGTSYKAWDGETLERPWVDSLEGADLLVNLAGRSVDCRYNSKNRTDIMESRVKSTSVLGEAIAVCDHPPKVWMNASTATIYRHAEDRAQGDYDGELGEGFSVDVAKAWENTFYSMSCPGEVRKVALRTAIVLSEEPDTVWTVLKGLARVGMGGTMGNGKQMVSWLHIEDFCRAVLWLYNNETMSGNVNVVAPFALTNRSFMGLVRRSVKRKWAFPIPFWALKLGALLRGTETELVLKSRWVYPTRLLDAGFTFKYPKLDGGLLEIGVDGLHS